MKTLTVELGERSYPILIGSGLLGESELVSPHIRGNQILIVSNETVAPLYLEQASKAFAEADVVSVPGGTRRRLTAGPYTTIAQDISPDGRRGVNYGSRHIAPREGARGGETVEPGII